MENEVQGFMRANKDSQSDFLKFDDKTDCKVDAEKCMRSAVLLL